MTTIKIREEKIKGCPVLKVEGRLDAASTATLEARLSSHLEKGVDKILIDFSKIEYLSSAGMRLLLSVNKRLQEAGGFLGLYSLRESVREIVKLAGFEKILTIYADEKEVIQTI
ncbi:MAG: STAS domain-containing protein [Candidatus Algichlamydia australiensis]|nr:STAS domain-containing protein [Chlamydiales bacterium]